MSSEPEPPDARPEEDAPAPDGGKSKSQLMGDLFRRYDKSLRSSVRARGGPECDVDAIVAQAYALTLQAADTTPISSLAAYLFRTAVNLTTRDGTRRVMSKRYLQLGTELDEDISPEQGLLDEEQSLLDDERRQMLQRIIPELSPKLRTALILRYWGGLSFAEMVEWYQRKQGISFNERTMRRHVAEAIAECRQQLLAAEEARK